MNIAPGTRIRDYNIIQKLGEGGMGSVWLAEDINLDRKVAIKVLNPVLTTDPQLINRFRQEAKVQAGLIHPNIVALYNFFQEGDHYCMVMEYVEGITLKEYVRQHGPIREDFALRLFSQMLEGVGYAHVRGIVHRDIKPSNILIDKENNIKVMDFGIAKIVGDKGMTKTGMKMGTVYYMSPEQVRAEKDIDQRTDIYSLGITLYEMVTGTIPFNTNTESDFEVMHEIVTGNFRDPLSFNSGLSADIIGLIKRTTQIDKNLRPVTCYMVLNDGDSSSAVRQNYSSAGSAATNFTAAGYNTANSNSKPGEQKVINPGTFKGALKFFYIFHRYINPAIAILGLFMITTTNRMYDEFSRSSDSITLLTWLRILGNGALAIWGYIIMDSFGKLKFSAVQKNIKNYLIATIASGIFFAVLPYILLDMRDKYVPVFISSVIGSLVWGLAWIQFFKKSIQVKELESAAADTTASSPAQQFKPRSEPQRGMNFGSVNPSETKVNLSFYKSPLFIFGLIGIAVFPLIFDDLWRSDGLTTIDILVIFIAFSLTSVIIAEFHFSRSDRSGTSVFSKHPYIAASIIGAFLYILVLVMKFVIIGQVELKHYFSENLSFLTPILVGTLTAGAPFLLVSKRWTGSERNGDFISSFLQKVKDMKPVSLMVGAGLAPAFMILVLTNTIDYELKLILVTRSISAFSELVIILKLIMVLERDYNFSSKKFQSIAVLISNSSLFLLFTFMFVFITIFKSHSDLYPLISFFVLFKSVSYFFLGINLLSISELRKDIPLALLITSLFVALGSLNIHLMQTQITMIANELVTIYFFVNIIKWINSTVTEK